MHQNILTEGNGGQILCVQFALLLLFYCSTELPGF